MPLRYDQAPAAGVSAAVKTLAVTDLVDSTGLFARLGDRRAAEISARHERLARDLLVRCEGREIDKTDGFLLLFDRAVDAVRFGLAYHRALAELAEGEGLDLEARVGIHLGEVILRANPPQDVARGAKPVEIEGYAKPIAARVMALAKGRQTLLTRGAFDLARQAAAREPVAGGQLRWLAHGPYALKGVAEPVEIFEVGETGFAPLLVPKSTAKARRAVAAGDEITLGWRPAPGLEVPRRPHWWLAEKLGEGGFGEVWRAAHEKTGESRVFKFCYQPDRLRSLQREVTLFRLLKETLGNRDDIARILDWSFDEAPYFLECEYTEGGNLTEWVADQGGAAEVPLATKLELMAQVAEALAAAHSVGVLHKDVKPSNVLVTTGRDGRPEVRLTDFGVGLVTDREVLSRRGITVFDLTEMVAESTGSAGGTHLYMAPELVEGRAATVQADVYALGVMLYQFVAGDFTRALAPGWRRDVPDEILQEDLADLVDGRPERRMRDAQRVAERLRTLEQRRSLREAERRQAAEREAERLALERAHRRRRLALAAAAVSIAVLLVVSLLAIQAIDARREAERRRGQAEGLIGFMVGDLREKLEPIGRLDVLDEVGDQALRYFESVPEGDLSDEELFRRSQALYQIGEVRSSAGDLEEAALTFEQSLALARKVVQRDPTNLEWQKGLGASHFGVGYALWRQGKLDEALVRFRSYREIAEGLVAAEPENPAWRLELAYAQSNIASMHEAQGDLERAEAALRESLAVRSELVESEPSNEVWRRDLAIGHNKLGAVLEAQGRPEAALEHFAADLGLTQSLVGERPDDTHRLYRLAVAESFVGNVLQVMGREPQALEHYSEGRRILEALTAADPSNLAWARDLAVHTRQQGSTLRKTGDSAAGLEDLRRAVSLLEDLVAENPSRVGWCKDLATSRLALAEILLDRGEVAESRDLAATAQSELERLAEPLAGHPELVVLQGQAHLLLGDAHSALSQGELASRSWRSSYELLEPEVSSSTDRKLLRTWALAAFRTGRSVEAAQTVHRLIQMGYRDEELLDLARRGGLEATGPGAESPRPDAGPVRPRARAAAPSPNHRKEEPWPPSESGQRPATSP